MSRRTKGAGSSIHNTFLRHLVNMCGGGDGFHKDSLRTNKINKDSFHMKIDYNIKTPKDNKDNRIGIRNEQVKKLL